MKAWGLAALAVLSVSGPAMAQESCAPECDTGLRGLVEGLMEQVAPLVDLAEPLGERAGELSGWHAPEVLPNGDILIRRRRPSDDAPAEDPQSEDAGPVTDPLEL